MSISLEKEKEYNHAIQIFVEGIWLDCRSYQIESYDDFVDSRLCSKSYGSHDINRNRCAYVLSDKTLKNYFFMIKMIDNYIYFVNEEYEYMPMTDNPIIKKKVYENYLYMKRLSDIEIK